MFHDFVIFLIDTGGRTYKEAMALPLIDVQSETNSILFWNTKSDEPRAVPMTARLKNIVAIRKAEAEAKNKLKLWYLMTKDGVRHYLLRYGIPVTGFTITFEPIVLLVKHYSFRHNLKTQNVVS